MRIRWWWIGLVAMSCAWGQVSGLRLGKPAPEMMVRDARGADVRLSEFRQQKGIVVLLAGDGAKLEPGALGVVAALAPGAEAATALIDSGGVVRRLEAGRTLRGAELAEFVALWQQGKAVFETSCARCHGVDGALDICLDVKKLTGIGTRLTAAQIRDKLRMGELNESEVVVRGQFFKRREVDAVLAYVSGL